jgi:hypothetical protein
MSVPMRKLRPLILVALGDEWQTPTELRDRLGKGYGIWGTWYAVCLTLERAANDGEIEIRVRGNRRTFRRRREPTS